MSWASIELHGGPPRDRRRAAAHLFELLEPTTVVGFAAIVEVTDRPPAWFDVPAIDLQPELLAAATRALHTTFGRSLAHDPPVIAARMLDAVNRELASLAEADPYKGSRAEGVVAVVTAGGVAIAWVGTARAYVVGSRGAKQVTRDHDLLTEWIAATNPTPDEIAAFPHRGLLTRILGASPACEIDTVEAALHDGDRLVLASPRVAASVEAVAPSGTPHDHALAVAAHAAGSAPGHAIAVAVIAS